MKAIHNVKIIGAEALILGKTLLFDDEIISIIPDAQMDPSAVEEIIDGKGKYLSPGFIDIHVHGCGGNDTMDDQADALVNISKTLATSGITSFLPTTMTEAFEHIEKALQAVEKLMNTPLYAEILGCHLEGPFISKKYKGAQDETYIIKPEFGKIEKYKDIIKLITLAPELEGSEAFIHACNKNNIRVSIGHSNATYEEAQTAIQWGARHITHTFNAMTPLHHRKPGIVGAAMNSDVSCELIVDNKHLHPAISEIMLRVKGNEKLILITDAMRACLMEDGEYDLGGQQVFVKEGAARLADGTLAGSILTLNAAVNNFINSTHIDLVGAIKMVSANPAKLLGIDNKKGSLEPEKDADMIVFDEDFTIYHTFVKGREVYRR